MMGKYRRLMAVFGLCALFLVGCGEGKVPDIIETPSVAVSKEGEITVWQVGLFDKADYVLSELQAMASEEAGQFNSSVNKTAAVTVEQVEALEDGSGRVVVSYRFDNWESASDFLQEMFFVGTVADAVQQGRTTGLELESTKDGAVFTEEQLQQTQGHVFITDMKGNVYCPGKVTHMSKGASVNADGSINTAVVEGAVCILYQ